MVFAWRNGLPPSRASSAESSSMFFSTRSASLPSRRPRSWPGTLRPHEVLYAWRAALTARSTSRADAAATLVSGLPVKGS